MHIEKPDQKCPIGESSRRRIFDLKQHPELKAESIPIKLFDSSYYSSDHKFSYID
jgi:hypothetical protein